MPFLFADLIRCFLPRILFISFQGLFIYHPTLPLFSFLYCDTFKYMFMFIMGGTPKKGGPVYISLPMIGGVSTGALSWGELSCMKNFLSGKGVRIHPTVIKYPVFYCLLNVYLSLPKISWLSLCHCYIILLLHAKRGWLTKVSNR